MEQAATMPDIVFCASPVLVMRNEEKKIGFEYAVLSLISCKWVNPALASELTLFSALVPGSQRRSVVQASKSNLISPQHVDQRPNLKQDRNLSAYASHKN